jgi:hypothetical protein
MSIKNKKLTGKLSETNDQKAFSMYTEIWFGPLHAAAYWYKQAVVTDFPAPRHPLTVCHHADQLDNT